MTEENRSAGVEQTTERIVYGDGYAVTGVADQGSGDVIVAEIAKTWTGNLDERPGTVSQYFENVIRTNERRGYRLRDWRFAATPLQRFTGGPGEPIVETVSITETIVAVFERFPEWAGEDLEGIAKELLALDGRVAALESRDDGSDLDPEIKPAPPTPPGVVEALERADRIAELEAEVARRAIECEEAIAHRYEIDAERDQLQQTVDDQREEIERLRTALLLIDEEHERDDDDPMFKTYSQLAVDYADEMERWKKAEAKIERLREYAEADARCPCCEEMAVCLAECTFADDCPEDHERMMLARTALEPAEAGEAE